MKHITDFDVSDTLKLLYKLGYNNNLCWILSELSFGIYLLGDLTSH